MTDSEKSTTRLRSQLHALVIIEERCGVEDADDSHLMWKYDGFCPCVMVKTSSKSPIERLCNTAGCIFLRLIEIWRILRMCGERLVVRRWQMVWWVRRRVARNRQITFDARGAARWVNNEFPRGAFPSCERAQATLSVGLETRADQHHSHVTRQTPATLFTWRIP